MADEPPDIKGIFLKALDEPSTAARRAYLVAACRALPGALERVEALLKALEEADSFLEVPAIAVDAPAGGGSVEPTLAITTTDALEPLNDARTAVVASTLNSAQGFDPAGIGPPNSQPLPPIAEGPGTWIGPYKLRQQIGEGGMGVVYMAEQETPVRRRVALKIIKPGMDTGQVVARFEAERQALALMDHPNIAKVLDAGATATGRPFFVMELVNGVPITEYCDQAQLTPRERLELFVPVCRAIQHAHQKGIIHRDVKPSNVLVTIVDGRPTPRVIDFGVAKATGQALTERSLFTQFGAIVGTLEYMSPEQAELSSQDVDTRSDVFSLGVLLFELLTGSTPLERARLREAGYAEILRRIREEEPPRPSTRLSDSGEALPSIAACRQTEPAKLTKLVRGELDWIVMRALEKDRTRRYESASGLAQDVEHYLADEAVQACPPSRRYRLRKFVRKNRVAITTATAFVVLLLVAAAGGGYLALRARSAERLAKERLADAERQREQAQAVSQFMVEAFHKPDPDEDGRELKVIDLLDKAAAKLDDRSATSPAIRGALLKSLAGTYLGLGLPDRAIDVASKALALLESALGPDHPETIDCRETLARAYLAISRTAEAITLAEETHRRMVARLGPDHPDLLKFVTSLANAYTLAGRTPEVIAMGEKALKLDAIHPGTDRREVLVLRHILADAHGRAGRTAEAIPLLEKVLGDSTTQLGPDDSETLAIRTHLAFYLRNRRPAEAIALLEKNLEFHTAKLGPNHLELLKHRIILADAYSQAGRSADAVSMNEETLKRARATLAPNHVFLRVCLLKLAQSYMETGRTAEAIPLCEEVTRLGGDDPGAMTGRDQLAEAYRKAGRVDEAIALDRETLRMALGKPGELFIPKPVVERLLHYFNATGRKAEAIDLRREFLAAVSARISPDDPRLLDFRNDLGEAYRTAGRVAEALPLHEETLKLATAKLGPDHDKTLVIRTGLAEAYREAGRLDDSIALNEETLKIRIAKFGPDHPGTVTLRNNLAVAYGEAGRGPESMIAAQEEVVRQSTKTHGSAHPSTTAARSNLATLYLKSGRVDEAVAIFEELIKKTAASVGMDQPQTLVLRNNLAVAYSSGGRIKEAIAIWREVVPAFSNTLGPGHPNTTLVKIGLAGLLDQTGRSAEAEVLFREALDQSRKNFAPDSPNLAAALAGYGRNLVLQERWSEAEPLLREASKISDSKQPDDWKTFRTRSVLGACLAGRRRFAEAEPLLVSGYEGMKSRESKLMAGDKPRLVEAAARVVGLYDAWGKPEEAAKWRRTLGLPAARPP